MECSASRSFGLQRSDGNGRKGANWVGHQRGLGNVYFGHFLATAPRHSGPVRVFSLARNISIADAVFRPFLGRFHSRKEPRKLIDQKRLLTFLTDGIAFPKGEFENGK